MMTSTRTEHERDCVRRLVAEIASAVAPTAARNAFLTGLHAFLALVWVLAYDGNRYEASEVELSPDGSIVMSEAAARRETEEE